MRGTTLNGTVTGADNDVDNTNAELVWSLVNGGSAAANGALTLGPERSLQLRGEPGV